MELGCFMAGTVISSQGEVVTQKVCGSLKIITWKTFGKSPSKGTRKTP